jgi:anaerobic ribonucleoside-triphosphate reductase
MYQGAILGKFRYSFFLSIIHIVIVTNHKKYFIYTHDLEIKFRFENLCDLIDSNHMNNEFT